MARCPKGRPCVSEPGYVIKRKTSAQHTSSRKRTGPGHIPSGPLLLIEEKTHLVPETALKSPLSKGVARCWEGRPCAGEPGYVIKRCADIERARPRLTHLVPETHNPTRKALRATPLDRGDRTRKALANIPRPGSCSSIPFIKRGGSRSGGEALRQRAGVCYEALCRQSAQTLRAKLLIEEKTFIKILCQL